VPEAPAILSNDAGSFAWSVLHDRHPALLERVQQELPYGPEQRRRFAVLLDSITRGVIEPLPETAHDHDAWTGWGAECLRRSWHDVPFLWAESYFYRQLLEASGYFEPGPWRGIDPFEPMKSAELTRLAAELGDLDGAELDGAELDGPEREDDAQALLLASVWGNRADLGFQLQAGSGGQALASGLIADDSHRIWAHLADHLPGRVTVVADNAGRELLADLLLIDQLLTSDLAVEVSLHVKPYPYYVSDATTADVVACLRTLGCAGGDRQDVAVRLRQALADGALTLVTHEFYCAPLTFAQAPADLAIDLGSSQLTLLKGDLNYRRLVGDNHWPPDTSFSTVVDHFPGPVAVLRTLKCDVIVGLDGDTLHGLDATGEAWRTSGTHAVIQARL
jgi:hypothetical protein